MSYEIYKTLHFIGISLAVMGLASTLFNAKRTGYIAHGLGLVFVLVGGFGMLARLGIHNLPQWVLIKLGVWIALGVSISLAKRLRSLALVQILLYSALVGFAGYIAIMKP